VQEARTTSYWRFAIPAALVIVALGSLSGYLSNSGYSNGWFEGLRKPSFMPPGWVFGVVWTTLYTLMGLAFAFVWLAWPSRLRRWESAQALPSCSLSSRNPRRQAATRNPYRSRQSQTHCFEYCGQRCCGESAPTT